MSALSLALEQLTPAQRYAVDWNEGPMFVLAGPGSGKTRVLTNRVARLLDDSSKNTFRVLALTFTNKAADEMRSRIEALVPEEQRRAMIGTFHSFCMQMLQQYGSHIGIKPDFAIYSLDADRLDILKGALSAEHLNFDPEKFLRTIDKLKARLILPDGCARFYRDSSVGEKVETAYKAYEASLSEMNALDFGSLIAQAYKLISTMPGIAMRYRSTYAYWLFDEFQDTTLGQYRLIQALAGHDFRNIFAVADDDQIIYQWNGASYQQIQRFRKDFQPEELQLPTNYRCPPSIVEIANQLVAHNAQRTTSKSPLKAGKTTVRYPSDAQVNLHRYSSDEIEAREISKALAAMGQNSWGETVVLARTRQLLVKIQHFLTENGVGSVIAQRRDDFRSPQFLWMSAALRQSQRPNDKRALEAMTGSFNRWFGLDIRADDIAATAELSGTAFLEEWAKSIETTNNALISTLADLAIGLSKLPSGYRRFIEQFLSLIENEKDSSIDIFEDLAAWSDLTVAISRSIGREAPAEQFLQELAMRSKEPPIGDGTVTLMTIHGAKGKEFDHVFVAGLAEQVLPSFQSVRAGEESAEMEEERRNCFVAITRAREWLSLSFADSYRGWRKEPSRFLDEMGLSIPTEPEK